jgi:hypothetical protein
MKGEKERGRKKGLHYLSSEILEKHAFLALPFIYIFFIEYIIQLVIKAFASQTIQ